jgi:hypothetical protein
MEHEQKSPIEIAIEKMLQSFGKTDSHPLTEAEQYLFQFDWSIWESTYQKQKEKIQLLHVRENHLRDVLANMQSKIYCALNNNTLSESCESAANLFLMELLNMSIPNSQLMKLLDMPREQ